MIAVATFAVAKKGREAEQLVDLPQRADKRLLTDGVFARVERLLDLIEVQVRWRADVDDVHVVHAAHLGEVGDDAGDAVLFGRVVGALAVDVAQGRNVEFVGDSGVAAQVRAADAQADDRHAQPFRHAATSSRPTRCA